MGLKDWGLEYNNPDFVMYAESYGAKGYRITSADNFSETLEACLSETGVHLIDCPVDYSENDEILNRRIQEISGSL